VWQRLAVRHGREFVKNGRVFVKHVVPAVAKPVRSLWNEVIGFVFFCFAVPFGFKVVSYVRAGDYSRLFVASFCFVLMTYFGVQSFRRARRISRS
jgi:hypothetical protein